MSALWLKDEAIIMVLFGAGSSSLQAPPGGGEAEQKATGWPWTLCLGSGGLLACKQVILLVHRPLFATAHSSPGRTVGSQEDLGTTVMGLDMGR